MNSPVFGHLGVSQVLLKCEDELWLMFSTFFTGVAGGLVDKEREPSPAATQACRCITFLLGLYSGCIFPFSLNIVVCLLNPMSLVERNTSEELAIYVFSG